MAVQQHVLSLINSGREIRRPPLVGMQFLHERPVRAANLVQARPGLNAKDLIGLLFSHFAGRRASARRTRITLCVFTPAGVPAVKISCQ